MPEKDKKFWDFDYIRHSYGGAEIKATATEGLILADAVDWTMTMYTEIARGNDHVRLYHDLAEELDSISDWELPDDLPTDLVEWQLTWETLAYDPSPHFARLIVTDAKGKLYLWDYDDDRDINPKFHG